MDDAQFTAFVEVIKASQPAPAEEKVEAKDGHDKMKKDDKKKDKAEASEEDTDVDPEEAKANEQVIEDVEPEEGADLSTAGMDDSTEELGKAIGSFMHKYLGTSPSEDE